MFNDTQLERLRGKLSPEHVRTRSQSGRSLSYIEGWWAIHEANEIFGYDAWTRELLELRLVHEGTRPGKDGATMQAVTYIARVRIVVNNAVVREGCGTGHGIDRDLGQAHESASKEAECVPCDVEILTKHGFVHKSKLVYGELVASYNVAHDKFEWVPVESISTYKDIPVVRMHNSRTFDALCTVDHKWVVSGHDGARYLTQACHIKAGEKLILASRAPGGYSELTPDEAMLLGFAICDGTFRKSTKGAFSSFVIYQSKPETVWLIDSLCKDIAKKTVRKVPAERTFPSGKTYTTLQSYLWAIPASVSQGWLSKLGIVDPSMLEQAASGLSTDARAALLRAMMLADGDKRGNFGKKRKPWIMRLFQTICALEGVPVGPVHVGKSGMPMQHMRSCDNVTLSNLKIDDAGTSDVWCPTTRNGTWVARFPNGLVTITGNTDAMKRALMTFGNPFGLALYDKSQANVGYDEPAVPAREPENKGALKDAKSAMQLATGLTGDELKELWGAYAPYLGLVEAAEAVRESGVQGKDAVVEVLNKMMAKVTK